MGVLGEEFHGVELHDLPSPSSGGLSLESRSCLVFRWQRVPTSDVTAGGMLGVSYEPGRDSEVEVGGLQLYLNHGC